MLILIRNLLHKIRVDMMFFILTLIVCVFIFGVLIGLIDNLSTYNQCTYESLKDYIPTRALVCEIMRDRP